jgi:zinc transport system substrate-binding protein
VRRVLVLLLVLATACGSGAASDRGGEVSAVATVYPLAWLAEAIAPDADVTFLGVGGAEAHDLELTPAQRQALESAQVIAYVGDIGFQPSIEETIAGAEAEVVSAAEVAGEQRLLPVAGDEHDGVDPHVWFDPRIMADVATRLGEAFAAADADRAGTYTANANAVRTKLLHLADEIDASLDDCRFDEVVVSHAAYGYLLEPRGIAQRGVSGPDEHAAASPAQIAELVSHIDETGIAAVLTEPVEGRRDAEAVAAEADVELVDIYSLDIVDEDQAERGYPRLLREQAQAAARALECGPAAGA